MSKTAAIKSEIIEAAGKHREWLPKVTEELDAMDSIEDIDGKGSILEKLYGIWKNSKGHTGHLNKINSWTACALGLTDKQPQGDFLPWRRCFARAGFPDVDSDFDDGRREEVIDYIVQKYGRDKVGNIGTYAQMHLKSVVRQLIKVLDIGGGYFKGKDEFKSLNRLKGDEVIGSLPKPQGNKLMWTDPDSGQQKEIKSVQDAYDYCPTFRQYMDANPDLMRHAKHLEGLCSTFGCHASGVVVSNHPLQELAPMRPAKKKKVWDESTQTELTVQGYATQFAYEDCETIGLIKFDVLGLKTLAAIRETRDLVKQKYEIDIDVWNLPLTDRRTFQLFKTGNLQCVFQVEKWGMTDTCKQIGVDRFEDIMAAIALYRPGPLINIPNYIARKKGLQKVDYFHPSIEKLVKPYLEKTYGICVYQEQIMQVCMAVAGFTITEGYVIIKAVGKKKFDLLNKYRAQFVAGAVKNGVPENVAAEYWDVFIIPFSNYGFNASHSCCYGYNSYLTGYLKAHFVEEYMCANLNVEAERKKWPKVAVIERDCRDKNCIAIASRSLNKCVLKYQIEQWARPDEAIRAIIRPSILCKGLSMSAAVEIVKKAPFKSIRDFATRCSKVVDNSSVESLAEAGFFSKPQDTCREFAGIRADLKKSHKLGFESGDMFE